MEVMSKGEEMSWRIGIGIDFGYLDASLLNWNEEEAKEIVRKYAWESSLKIIYGKGYEEELLKFVEMLEEDGRACEDVWTITEAEVKYRRIGEHIEIEKLEKKLKSEKGKIERWKERRKRHHQRLRKRGGV